MLGSFSALQIVSMSTYLGRLSDSENIKSKYSGIYTSIYKSSLFAGLFFSAVLLSLIDQKQ